VHKHRAFTGWAIKDDVLDSGMALRAVLQGHVERLARNLYFMEEVNGHPLPDCHHRELAAGCDIDIEEVLHALIHPQRRKAPRF